MWDKKYESGTILNCSIELAMRCTLKKYNLHESNVQFREAVASPLRNLKECKTHYTDIKMHSNILILALNDWLIGSCIAGLTPFLKTGILAHFYSLG